MPRLLKAAWSATMSSTRKQRCRLPTLCLGHIGWRPARRAELYKFHVYLHSWKQKHSRPNIIVLQVRLMAQVGILAVVPGLLFQA